TSRATGGFRAQFATEVNVRMSLLAREELRARPEFGYQPHGYLFLARSEEALRVLRVAQNAQRFLRSREEQISVRLVTELRPRAQLLAREQRHPHIDLGGELRAEAAGRARG